MGVGVSGFCEASHFDKDDYTAAYRAMESLDEEYSREIKAEKSVKLTTVKPSGTVSLLPGVTPGVHPAFSRYYIRRIRFSADDPIVSACRRNGFHVEPKVEFDGTLDHGTQIVSFPVDVGPDTVVANDVSAVRQMDMQKFLQTYWSDNAVSVTVYYRDEELPEVKQKLASEYRDGIKTISFTKHSKHGFKQAPYEEITASQYAEMASKVKPIGRLDDAQQWDIVDSLECSSGSCPVK
jgi:adenosylcobalamin-dependent ribonucleoside-triphosphate reductase